VLERRDQAGVDLDGDQLAGPLAQGARQRAQAGPISIARSCLLI
jgi:hypothetical protein